MEGSVMEKKKIAETINIRINVGNYQHIEISKYAEQEIEYDSPEEMVEKEDQLTSEIVDNLVRNMRTIPEKLGKDTDAVEKVEERLTKTLPDFMKGSQEPNLAKKKSIQAEAEEKSNSDAKEEKVKEKEEGVADLVGNDAGENKKEDVEQIDGEEDLFVKDLFE